MALVELVGDSPAIVAVRDQVSRLLRRQSPSRRLPPLLLLGETGTGKGLLAHAAHRAVSWRQGPFVAVNCAAIPESLVEAELFGFERGAFTDARQAKIGLIQAADRGTLFLDEVGLLSEAFQAKLLTVVEDQIVRRVGSTRGEPVDVWIVAATSVDLAAAVHAGRFREDLYHRLAVLSIVLPPLRERDTDILLLAQRFLDRAGVDYGLPPKALSAGARAALLAYAWPGNVRELANIMERVMLLLDDREVAAESLGLPSSGVGHGPAPASATRSATSPPSLSTRRGLRADVEAFERDQLLRALEKNHWNVSRAATQLGVSRNTLRYRIARHGIEPADEEAVARRRPVRNAKRSGGRTPSNHQPMEATAPSGRKPLIPRAPRWETRSVVLLGVALRTSPSEDAIRSSTAEVLEAFVERTETFGGRVDALGPYGAVATFGLESADEAPGRAALAALAVRRAAARLSAEGRLETAVVLALHSGPFLLNAAADTGPRLSMDARRQAEETLDILLSATAPNTIVACPQTALLLERRFVLEPGPVVDHVGAVQHLIARDVSNLGLGRRPIRPFVGRDHELRHIRGVLAEVLGGSGRIVGIVGEPGIGKTRLLYEVRRSLAGKDLAWREGRCAPHGPGVPYLPVLDLLRDHCGVTEFDSSDVVLAAVNRALETAGLDPLEGVPYLVRLLGMDVGSERFAGFTPDEVRARTLEVLSELLIRSSHQRPLVMCVKDLQWIDRPSEEFLASLVERLPGAPVLLVASYRPGYRPPWLGKSYAMQVTLAGLTTADSLKIIQATRTGKGPLEGSVAEAIAARADGNPFFLEELARSLPTCGSMAVPPVPATIQDVLMERIVRVPEGPRRCLQVASVLGRSFALDHLEEICDRPAGLVAHLSELRHLEFLHETHKGSGRSYRFKHALTQEVAYASLLPAERERLHGAAGRALERSCAGRLDEVADRLAYHFARSALPDKAVEYLGRFAERAARSYAHAEAAAALEQALEYLRRWDDATVQRRLAEVILALASSLYFLGRFRDIRDLLSRYRADIGELGDAGLLGRYYFRLAHTADLLGDHDEAIDNAQRAVQEAQRAGDDTTQGQAHYVLTRQGFWAGQLHKANEHGRDAIACLQRTPERWWLGMAHWAVGVNCAVLGELAPAFAAFAQAEAVGDEIRDRRLLSYAAFGTGWLHAAAGNGPAAIEACQRGVEHAPDPVNRNYATAFLGLAHLVNGEARQAIALLEPVISELARFEFRQPQGWHSAMLAEAYLATGSVNSAHVAAMEGLRLTTETGYRHGMGWARRVLGRIEMASERLEEAASHLQIALELFHSIDAQIDVAQTRVDLASLAWRGGDSVQARAQLTQALALWRALDVRRWVERSECLAAEWDSRPLESEAAFPTQQRPAGWRPSPA